MQLQSDAEHQEDDADLGKLLGNAQRRPAARRVGTDGDPGEQVADDG